MPASRLGLCAACGRTFKVDDKDLLSKHGYRRPWHIHREVGRCHGALRLPHELSPEVAEETLVALAEGDKSLRNALRRLKSGEVTSITIPRPTNTRELITLTSADGDRFERAVAREIITVEGQIDSIDLEAKRIKRLLVDWHPRPLAPIVVGPEKSYLCNRCKTMQPRGKLQPIRMGMMRGYACKALCEPRLKRV